MQVNENQQFSVTNILQNIYFAFLPKNESHTGLKLLEGEYMITEFPFWLN